MTDLDNIYNMVDFILEEKDCPEGFRWCKFQKKCVPAEGKGEGQGMGRGKASGPMGNPYKTQEEMFAVDNPEFEKIKRKVDVLVDSALAECPESEPNEIKNVPDENPDEEFGRVHYAIAGYNNPEETENEYPPGPQDENDYEDTNNMRSVGKQLESIFSEGGDYKKYFKKMMDKEGIVSIGDLTDKEKKDFFKKVDREWKARNESLQEKGEYHLFFKRMMDEEGIKGIASLSPEEKSSFFKKVSNNWKKEKGKSIIESFLKLNI